MKYLKFDQYDKAMSLELFTLIFKWNKSLIVTYTLGFLMGISISSSGQNGSSGALLPGEDSILTLIQGTEGDSIIMEWYNQLRRLTIYEDPIRSLGYALKYGEYADRAGLPKRAAFARFYQGNSQIALGNYEEALQAYLFADTVFRELNDTALMASVSNSIGVVYEKTGRDSLAIHYYVRMIELSRTKGDVPRILIGTNNLSNIYYRAGNYKKSRELLEELVTKANQDVSKDHLIQLKLNYANTLLKLKDYRATEDVLASIEADADRLDNYARCLLRKGLGTLYLETERRMAAVDQLEQALGIIEENHFQQERIEVLELLGTAYERAGYFDKALVTYRQFISAKDSLLNEERDKNLINALTRYETEKKEQEIQLLTAQNEIKDLKIRQRDQQRIVLFAGLGLLALLAFLGFRLQHIRRKTNIQLKKKNAEIERALEEKSILLKEIHHRVKNNLQVISSLLKLQSHYITDSKALSALSDGRNRVQSMALLHKKLYREDDMLGVDMKSYFSELVEGLFDAYHVNEKKIRLDLEVEAIRLDVDTVIPLGLIANELISNALKHAFTGIEEPALVVRLFEEDNKLILSIRDNGKGMPIPETNENRQSFGYKLIESLSGKLQADLSLDSGEGTEVRLSIKDYQKTGSQ